MYNLAHIYIYNEEIKSKEDKAIDILIKSSESFYYSQVLLSLMLINKLGFNIKALKSDIQNEFQITNDLLYKILSIIYNIIIRGKAVYDHLFNSYRKLDFLYNIELIDMPNSDLDNIDDLNSNQNNLSKLYKKDITSAFYDGFGHDLCWILK